MSTTIYQAAAAGVRDFGRDPQVRALVEQISMMQQAWFAELGYVIEETKVWGDYLLNGNSGHHAAYVALKKPDSPDIVRVVFELRIVSEETSVIAWGSVRKADRYTTWQIKNSPAIKVNYEGLQGIYKMKVVADELRRILKIDMDTKSLPETSLHALVVDLMIGHDVEPFSQDAPALA